MEKFKAVEKAMKTKAYSKEGLSAAATLDPQEQAKVECIEFLSGTVDELEQQIETLEAESESLSATMKKGKNQSVKAERIARIEEIIDRHKWHQGKLELIRRSLENGNIETEQVMELEESIKYYVTDGMNDDFMDDDELYDELDLEDEEGNYGMAVDNEKNSSHDTQSQQEDATPEPEAAPTSRSRKAQKESEAAALRRPSAQTKSPLPALATLHTPLPTISSTTQHSGPAMKPAQVPTRPAGEGLKYASAAAAAAASDKNNVGIAPLPPPPGSSATPGISPLPPIQSRTSATSSPASTSVQPVAAHQNEPKPSAAAPAPSEAEPSTATPAARSKKSKAAGKQPAVAAEPSEPARGMLRVQLVRAGH